MWLQRKRAAQATWVPPHKDESHFIEHGIPEWRRLVNDDVDAICRRLSGEAYSRDHASWLKQVDSLCQEVSLHLAHKVTF